MSGESHSQKVDLQHMGGSHVHSEEGAQLPRGIPEKDHWQSIVAALTELRRTYHSIDHIPTRLANASQHTGPPAGARIREDRSKAYGIHPDALSASINRSADSPCDRGISLCPGGLSMKRRVYLAPVPPMGWVRISAQHTIIQQLHYPSRIVVQLQRVLGSLRMRQQAFGSTD